MDIKQSIVGILGPGGQTIGTGFLASESTILTCAHLIQQAGIEPGGQVSIRFAADLSAGVATVDARHWSPVEGHDVALLHFDHKPAGALHLPLGASAATQGHHFRSYGYAKVGALQGVGARGEIIELVDQGNLLQITSPQVDRGFSGSPIVDESRRVVVGMVTWGKVSTTSERHRDTTFAVTTETLLKVCPELRVSDVCPFRSLDAFTEEDADFFFGRQRVIERLLESLRREPRFLAVLGPSGCGKSSVVKAGLIPAIRNGQLPGSKSWGVLSIRPQAQPFEQLAAVGLDGLGDSLIEPVQKWLTTHTQYSRLVLVIDQFEELLVNAPLGVQQQFIDQLAKLLDSPTAVSIVLVMRDDFYSNFQVKATPLAGWMERGLVNIPPLLDDEEIHLIVTRPALATGLSFEDGLVDVVLADVRATDQSGKLVRSTILPLLEFALTQLWENRQDGQLTHSAYRGIGGVTGGLSQWADRAYYSMEITERESARYILGELVHPGEKERNSPDTRQVKTVDDISRDQVTNKVIQRLVQARLLSTGRDELRRQDTVEIIHEALIYEWGLLKKWLDEDREFLSWREHLREELERWDDSGNKKDALLIGLALTQAETWMKNRSKELSLDEQGFIVKSIQRRERSRRITIAGVAAAMIVIMAILVGWGITSTNAAGKLADQVIVARTAQGESEVQANFARTAQAESDVQAIIAHTAEAESLKQANIARSNQLSAQAQLELTGGRPERGVLLALEALEKLPYTPQAELALGTSVMQSRARLILSGHTGRVFSASWSKDGKFVVTAGADGTARVWNAVSGKELFVLRHPDAVNDANWSPDSSFIVTACDDGIARVWDANSGAVVAELSGHLSPVHSADWSTDGAVIDTTSGKVCGNGCAKDTLVRLWDAHTWEFLGELPGHSSTVNDAAWAPDGSMIVSVSGDAYTNDRSARVWSRYTREELLVIEGFRGEVTSISWAPDSSRFVTGQFNGPLRMLDAISGEEILTFEGHTDIKWSVDWSPDGNRIASSSRDRSIRIWDASTGKEQLQLLGHSDGVNHVAWSPDGKSIVTTSDDGTARIWDASPGPELLSLPGDGSLNGIAAWSPDGQHVATSSSSNAQVWDVRDEKTVFSVTTNTNSLNDLAWSPNGERLATIGWDPGLTAADLSIWDSQNGRNLLKLAGHTFFVTRLAWSPDGTQIVTTSPDKTAIIWDVEKGIQLMTITHPDEAVGVAWSPVGDQFITTCLDGIGRIWDANTGKQNITLDGAVGDVRWSPDGLMILSAGENDTALIWDAKTGKQVLTLEGHTGSVTSLTWSPGGDRIATGSTDRTARIWDALSGNSLLILTGHTNAVTAVSWSPDGTRLATASPDGTAKIWRVWQTTAELLSYAHECCAIRELSEQERQQFNLP